MANSLFGNDYDSVQVGGSRSLPADGYICRIIKAQMTESSDGLPMIEALFDICEGEYANYFNQKYRESKERRPDAEYPRNGRIRLKTMDANGKTKKMWKGFNTSVEKSNDINLPRDTNGYLNALSGKLVGIIFGREEFPGSDGKRYWTTKPRWYRSVEDIQNGNFEIPEDSYYSAPPTSTYSMPDNFSAAQDDIPF